MAQKRVTDDLIIDVLKTSVVEGMLPHFVETLTIAAAITVVLIMLLFWRHHRRCRLAQVTFLGQPTKPCRTLADVQELAEEAQLAQLAKARRKFFWQKKADA